MRGLESANLRRCGQHVTGRSVRWCRGSSRLPCGAWCGRFSAGADRRGLGRARSPEGTWDGDERRRLASAGKVFAPRSLALVARLTPG